MSAGCIRAGVLSIISSDAKAPTRVVIGEPLVVSLHDPDLSDISEPTIRLLSRRTEDADDESITLKSSKPETAVLETYQVFPLAIIVA